MKKFVLALLLCITISSWGPLANVYVCDSNTSVAYHAIKNCRGLNRCTHTIVEVAADKAVREYHKRRCKVCF